MICLKFESEKTPGEVYEMKINDLKESIALNAHNKEKLLEIKREIYDALDYIDKLQFEIWQQEQEAKNRNRHE